jgi:hypothetical protein
MKKEYKLTSQGSLGLLALGHIGLRLWREIEKTKEKQIKQTESKDDQQQKK